MGRGRLLWTLIALAALAFPSAAQATFPGPNGRIAFDSDQLGARNVFTMVPGAGSPSLIGPGSDPAWSADGRFIAVDSGRIYDTEAGSVSSGSATQSPAWSPDGTKIAYVSHVGFDSEIFVRALATGATTRLTTHTGLDIDPAWSPDGTKIAFATLRGAHGPNPDVEIFTMDPAGGNLQNVTDTATNEIDPNWSPDGTKLVFTSEGFGYDVFSMNADGSGRTQLTTSPANEMEPVWSPDGTAIAFQARQAFSNDIIVTDSNGANPQNITNSTADEARPDWQPARSAVFTVNTTDDSNDGSCDSSHCSLREAIVAANTAAGRNRIEFAILPGGPQTIRPQSELPAITEEVTVNGAEQPGFQDRPLIEIEGSAAGGGADGLTVSAGETLIRSVLVNNFDGFGIRIDSGAESEVRSSYVGVDHSGAGNRPNEAGGIGVFGSDRNVIGDRVTSGPPNVISSAGGPGILLGFGTGDTDIFGNHIGLRADGAGALGGTRSANPGVLVEFGASHSLLASNVITGNQDGVVVRGDNTRLQRNRVGSVNAPGVAGNARWGVRVEATTIAMGLDTVQSNLDGGVDLDGQSSGSFASVSFSFNAGPGVRIGRNATGSLGNSASTNNTGNGIEVLGRADISSSRAANNSGHGVALEGSNSFLRNNRVQNNGGAGIAVLAGERNKIELGQTHGNGGPGIDLEGDGVTLNDESDADTGANGRQNFPVLTEAVRGSTSTTVAGYLQSKPNTSYVIDLELAAPCDSTGHGERNFQYGARFTVTTDATGRATFSVSRALALRLSDSVVATATDALGNTSELSRCRPFTRGPAENGTLTVNTPLDGFDGTCSAQHCTLREAIEQSNLNAGAERIAFALPGGVTTIRPAHALPSLTGPVVVDGTSQPGYAGDPLVRIDGSDVAATADGLVLSGGFSTVKGMAIEGFGGWGLTVRGGPDNRVGGSAGEGNRIARNGHGGVRVLGEGALEGNFTQVLRNSIEGNSGLGIDLEGDGVNANDPLDADTGANRLQNTPVITQVGTSGGTTHVEGRLEAEPSRSHVVQLFDSTQCDPSGFGEGGSLVDSFEIATAADGRATFSRDLPAAVALPNAVTATATLLDSAGGGAFTSEFSRCAVATTDLSVAIVDAPDPVKVGKELLYTVTVMNEGPSDAQGVSLRVTVPPHGGRTSTSFTQGTCTRTSNLRRCELGDLAAGAEAVVRITIKPKDRGTATATATVSAVLPPDTDPGNDAAVAETLVQP